MTIHGYKSKFCHPHKHGLLKTFVISGAKQPWTHEDSYTPQVAMYIEPNISVIGAQVYLTDTKLRIEEMINEPVNTPLIWSKSSTKRGPALGISMMKCLVWLC